MTPPAPIVDLHAHVLPRVDDGARDESQALAMLRIAADDGTRTIVATPHAHHAVRHGFSIHAGVARLNALAREAGMEIEVLPGCEMRIASAMVERVCSGEIPTLNASRYLLLELPLHDEWPLPLLEGAIDKLLAAGIVPILAHAERYPFVQRDPRVLRRFVARDIPVQINARSLLYREGDRERVTAEGLLHARLAHLIASDAHNDGYRAPRLRAAIERARLLTNDDTVDAMLARAIAIIRDTPVELPQPEPGEDRTT